MEKKQTTKTLVQTGMLIAISVVLGLFSYMVYFAGGAGMRISLAGFVSKLPAVLFGPAYGGMASAAIDVLTFIVKPDGGYLLPLTLTAALGGVLVGFLFRLAKNIDVKKFKLFFALFFVVIGLAGLVFLASATFFEGGALAAFIAKLGKKQAFVTILPEAISVIGIILIAADSFISKKFDAGEDFIKLLCVLMVANLIITTINTFVLMTFIPVLAKNGFWIFYIPRLAEELVITIIQSYIMSCILKFYHKISR